MNKCLSMFPNVCNCWSCRCLCWCVDWGEGRRGHSNCSRIFATFFFHCWRPLTWHQRSATIAILREHHLSQREIHVNIRRKHIWADYKEAREKYSIAPRDNIRVVFLGELDVDDGGPRREFFQVTSTWIVRPPTSLCLKLSIRVQLSFFFSLIMLDLSRPLK